MAKTLSYVQEHGYNTVEDVEDKLTEIKELASSSRKELNTVCTNIHAALGRQHTKPAHKQAREDIS